jgi:hypothetical protein
MSECPPIIRELASPLSSYLHLKAVVGPREHDHDKPTLCGQEDHGSWTYAVPRSQAEFERLVQENGDDAVYPLCPFCAGAFVLRRDSQADPDHLNPAKGGNRAADDYWREG